MYVATLYINFLCYHWISFLQQPKDSFYLHLAESIFIEGCEIKSKTVSDFYAMGIFSVLE